MRQDIPDTLTRLDNLSGVPAVAKNMHAMLKLLEANAANMESGDLEEFIEEGKTVVGQIESFDSAQDRINVLDRRKNAADRMCR